MTAAAVPTVGETGATSQTSGAGVAAAALRRLGASLLVVVVALVVLAVLWVALLRLLDVSTFVGKTPFDVWSYLVAETPPRAVRASSITAEAARSQLLGAWLVTLADAAIGFATGLLVASVVAALFVVVRPFEFAFMPIAMLLRSVPLVAMAPVLLLIFGQGRLGVATIGAIVVLFPALVNIVLGLRSASPLALDLVKVNGGGELKALLLVRVPSALPAFFASVRISVPGAIVGAMLAEWLSGFTGLGGILNAYKGRGNFSGVWAIVVVSVVTSIVGYAVAAVVEAAALAAWGPEAGRSARR
ncbi:ABC-type nitrate/sulfonate/bicarbonate transport system, permease component [Microlunatus sagamiharensis]|uniref:ABC-type nitrate/sulfonate/bicarbonate transport system, permease component n=1 Tax=Microlunatus sagamiharensis TaxID=546874 RepID=A0A1H2MYV9_9ACTN|nr:ABC transporter permease subunit [Microlunatus sagamiharensis]SDU98168.1 ABC-type nitrate/sulfonate/bicarbonate transport system, permease component [Microlunatus sagamiharensis]